MRPAMVRIVGCLTTLIAVAAVAAVAQTQAVPKRVTVPAGTRLLVRTVHSLDSSKQRTGQRFTASLETNLWAEDTVVAPRGTTVHGRLAEAKAAGRAAGGASLVLELTDIVINGTAYPLMTNAYSVISQGKGEETAARTVGGVGLGTIVGALAGGGTGAAIGAVSGGALGGSVSAATPSRQANVPSESLLEFRLEQQVRLPVAHEP